jgi:PucR C-terminal helix-turn-helix domain/GGDEF-like domain
MTQMLSVDPMVGSSRIRAAGQAWTAGERTLADRASLAATFTAVLENTLRAEPVTAAKAALAAGKLVDALLAGLDSRPPRPPAQEIAAELLAGRPVPGDVALAETYAVAVVRAVTKENAEKLRASQSELAMHGVLAGPGRGDIVLLVPGNGGKSAERILRDLATRLTGAWVAISGARPRAEAPAALEEAREVLRVAVASRREPGLFGLADVLVDYAIAANKAVTAELAEIVRPLAGKETLWTTLMHLIDADFNRNEAARTLVIHRSTLDYRVTQIAKLTGYDPTSAQGAQLLSAATTAHGLVSGG